MTNLKRCFQCVTAGVGQGLVLTAILVSPVSAQQSPENLAPAIDPFADELLQDLGQYIDEAEQFTFQAQIEVDELSPRGQKVQYSNDLAVAVRRPNGLLRFRRATYATAVCGLIAISLSFWITISIIT